MGDASVDDMNATPLGKLPPPIMQSKQALPAIDAPNYRDLLNEMERKTVQPTQAKATEFAYMPPSQPVQQVQPVQQAQQVQPMQQVQQSMQPPPPRQYYDTSYYPEYEEQYGAVEEEPVLENNGSLLSRFLSAHKAALIVMAVVLVALVFLVPRLTQMPRFAGVDGRLNMLGKLVTASAAGSAYHIALLVV